MTRFPPPPPGAERRAHPRHDVVVSVEVVHDDVIAIAALTNISHGGAFVELDAAEAMTIGVRVRVSVAVGGHAVSEEAKVVRLTRGGCALAWTAPSKAIGAIVEHLTAGLPRALAS